mmetsp:Transcript_29733/g.79903  ORF Transcript_29733/g.79903 Transcript_29733/m.79903 type:complete len:221 (-) Transcript_29733:480-1142(-)
MLCSSAISDHCTWRGRPVRRGPACAISSSSSMPGSQSFAHRPFIMAASAFMRSAVSRVPGLSSTPPEGAATRRAGRAAVGVVGCRGALLGRLALAQWSRRARARSRPLSDGSCARPACTSSRAQVRSPRCAMSQAAASHRLPSGAGTECRALAMTSAASLAWPACHSSLAARRAKGAQLTAAEARAKALALASAPEPAGAPRVCLAPCVAGARAAAACHG